MRNFQKINLKCEGSQLWGDKQTERRWKQTFKRVRVHNPYDNVLDIGSSNTFGYKMALELKLSYGSTSGDLNSWIGYMIKYENMFLFEVIEHIMNPLALLIQLESYLNDTGQIFVTYPHSPILQGKRHFHEMTPNQFYTLIDEAGFRIIDYDTFRNFLNWKKYFTGIRPLIKLFMQIVGLSKIHFYVLRKK